MRIVVPSALARARNAPHDATSLGLVAAVAAAVLEVVRRREASHRGEAAVAAGPPLVAFRGRLRASQCRRAVLAADRLDPRVRVLEPLAQTVDLHEQDAARVYWLSRADR